MSLHADPSATSSGGRIHISSPRDWSEDFAHDNGNYSCHCCVCHQTFVGYKRRVVCKVCGTEGSEESDRRDAAIRAAGLDPEQWILQRREEFGRTMSSVVTAVIERNQERKLRRELANACGYAVKNLGPWHHILKDAIADSEKLDAEIVAKERAKREKAT